MATRAPTFVHLTDLHLTGETAEEPSLLTDTARALRHSLAEIERMQPAPDFIVMSGDLTDQGDAAAYETLKTMIAALPPEMPVVLSLGNHDRRAGFCQVFPHLHADPDRPYCHDRVIGDLHVIALDSLCPGLISGVLDADQIAWLKARLAEHRDRAKLIVVHHPPLLDPDQGADAWHALDWPSSEALREALTGHSVIGVLSGHIHLNRVIHWYGIPVVIGAGHHAAADPLAPRDIIRLIDSAGFAVCTVQPCGLTATFIAHPQTGAELRAITTESIRAREAASRSSRSA